MSGERMVVMSHEQRDWHAAQRMHAREMLKLTNNVAAAELWRECAERHDAVVVGFDVAEPPDESPGDVIEAYADGAIVLDDGITTYHPLRACTFLAAERDRLRDAASPAAPDQRFAQIRDLLFRVGGAYRGREKAGLVAAAYDIASTAAAERGDDG